MQHPPELVVSHQRVVELARELAAAGRFSLDLEFVSESRYVPELSLVQVGWEVAGEVRALAIDVLEVDPEPVVRLVGDADVEKVLHASQGDLALLGHEFGVRGVSIRDSQIGAAFVGIGEQVGYATLVEETLGVPLDKTLQFTEWLDRPLAAEQIRYALDDVIYLLPAWALLEERLAERGRLDWVLTESERVAAAVAVRQPPEERWKRIKGRGSLSPMSLGALRLLAAWREEEALVSNRPPSWIIPDRALVALVRAMPGTARALRAIDGIGPGTVRQYGDLLLRKLREGAADPLPAERRRPRLPGGGKRLIKDLSAGLDQACSEAGIGRRFVANKADLEDLAEWWLLGDRKVPPPMPLLEGWRREVAGDSLLEILTSYVDG